MPVPDVARGPDTWIEFGGGLFHKLQRDVARLDRAVTHDKFFNLVITGYSLIDWVKNDPSLPAAARTSESITGCTRSPG